jgi:hypothetical protein
VYPQNRDGEVMQVDKQRFVHQVVGYRAPINGNTLGSKHDRAETSFQTKLEHRAAEGIWQANTPDPLVGYGMTEPVSRWAILAEGPEIQTLCVS